MRTEKADPVTRARATRGLVTRPLASVLLAMGAISVAASSGSATAPPTGPPVPRPKAPYYKAGATTASGHRATWRTAKGMIPEHVSRSRRLRSVVDTSCTPIANAKVETWQADASGAYDNAGYTLRGWVTTDASGRFTIETVVPGEYPGRTEHIHVKVTPSGGATLTTQVYFPGSTANGEDGIYDPSLDLVVTADGDALTGTFTFVIGS